MLPGNKEFVAGDRIEKPKGGGGGGRAARARTPASGEDPFSFALTEAEFLDILFEDLELPDLVKASLKDATAREFRRAGYTSDGATPNLAVLRTMRVSMGRRMALRRPSPPRSNGSKRSWRRLRAKPAMETPTSLRIGELDAEIERLKRRQRAIPFIDPIDVRYNRFTPVTVPRAKAVMFCLMDVSASMGEREKDLAKRFFILLHLFLKRKYERVDIVFIRHTHEAAEVDEQEFFYGRETGGTVVSSALKDDDRRPRGALPDRRLEHLLRAGLRRRQFGWRLARVRRAARPGDPAADPVLRLYRDRRRGRVGSTPARRTCGAPTPGSGRTSPNFAMARVAGRADIYPVFRKLFARAVEAGGGVMSAATVRPGAPAGDLLFDGAEWDFATVRRVYDAIDEIARDELGLDVFPNQIEIISAEQMLDAYSLGRHAAHVRALVLRQALRPRRGALPQGLPGARLRDRHQLQSVHQLLHGGEHDGDADAGHRPRRLRPQPLLQEQLSLPAVDRSRPASSTISTSPSAMSPPARSGTAWRRSRRLSTPRMR